MRTTYLTIKNHNNNILNNIGITYTFNPNKLKTKELYNFIAKFLTNNTNIEPIYNKNNYITNCNIIFMDNIGNVFDIVELTKFVININNEDFHYSVMILDSNKDAIGFLYANVELNENISHNSQYFGGDTPTYINEDSRKDEFIDFIKNIEFNKNNKINHKNIKTIITNSTIYDRKKYSKTYVYNSGIIITDTENKKVYIGYDEIKRIFYNK